MKTLFETKRLISREFLPMDAMNLFKLNSDKKVIEFTGDEPFKNIQEAEKLLKNNIMAQYEKNGFGLSVGYGIEVTVPNSYVNHDISLNLRFIF